MSHLPPQALLPPIDKSRSKHELLPPTMATGSGARQNEHHPTQIISGESMAPELEDFTIEAFSWSAKHFQVPAFASSQEKIQLVQMALTHEAAGQMVLYVTQDPEVFVKDVRRIHRSPNDAIFSAKFYIDTITAHWGDGILKTFLQSSDTHDLRPYPDIKHWTPRTLALIAEVATSTTGQGAMVGRILEQMVAERAATHKVRVTLNQRDVLDLAEKIAGLLSVAQDQITLPTKTLPFRSRPRPAPLKLSHHIEHYDDDHEVPAVDTPSCTPRSPGHGLRIGTTPIRARRSLARLAGHKVLFFRSDVLDKTLKINVTPSHDDFDDVMEDVVLGFYPEALAWDTERVVVRERVWRREMRRTEMRSVQGRKAFKDAVAETMFWVEGLDGVVVEGEAGGWTEGEMREDGS